MDSADCAGRILARAFGYGRAWEARQTFGVGHWQPIAGEKESEVSIGSDMEDEAPSAVSEGLPICRETETLERASDSVSGWIGKPDARPSRLTSAQRRARARLPDAELERLWSWERANPLAKGQGRSPYRPREFEHWKRTRSGAGVQVMRPLHSMDRSALEALAGIVKPLQSTLLLYALQDGKHWPTAERYARAVLPAQSHAGIEEGMYRLLVMPPLEQRARAHKMRRAAYQDMSDPAFLLFSSWVDRAAQLFLSSLDRPAKASGSQGEGRNAETWWRPPLVR